MKNLKLVLRITGALSLLGFLGLILPWNFINGFIGFLGLDPMQGDPLSVYALRIGASTYTVLPAFFS